MEKSACMITLSLSSFPLFFLSLFSLFSVFLPCSRRQFIPPIQLVSFHSGSGQRPAYERFLMLSELKTIIRSAIALRKFSENHTRILISTHPVTWCFFEKKWQYSYDPTKTMSVWCKNPLPFHF